MDRRRFLKCAGMVGASAMLPTSSLSVWGLTPTFTGDFLLYIQVSGGWDVTSFCDPKINVAGEKIINNWAATAATQTAGNLRYAPVGNNARFFNDHHQKMLVINGINARTNAHDAGSRYAHSGSMRKRTPHLAALYAYEQGQGMAMPVMAGGRFVSGGLVPPTTLGNAALQLIDPNLRRPHLTAQYVPVSDLDSIRALRQHQAESLISQKHLLPRQYKQINDYYQATFADTRGFETFGEFYFELDSGQHETDRHTDSLKFALSAFRSGLGIAADMRIRGFDSHAHHDVKFADSITTLCNAVSCAWHYAEQLGIADRLVVVMGSEFGRTPRYNSSEGKDHWPYGSTVIMKKHVHWTNRMLGYTDDRHVGQPINPYTLQVDKRAGTEIEPKHVMHALRGLLGVANTTAAARFDLDADVAFNFFGA